MFRRLGWNAAAATVIATALLLATNSTAFAHGGGVIRLASKQVPVGGTLALTGEKLEKNAQLRLELRGTLDNYPVGEIRTDTAGAFTTSIVLPPHVPAGSYMLAAIGPDGDVDARTDLTISAAGAPAAAGGMAGMPGMGGHGTQEMPGMHATGEMMALNRATSGGEWAVIALFLLLAFGGGAMLLAKSAAARHG